MTHIPKKLCFMLFGYKSPQSTQYMRVNFKARKFQTWPEGEVIPLVAGLSLMPNVGVYC